MRPSWDELYASDSHFKILGSPSGPGPKGGKHYVRPSGYAAIPGTGPVGETCRSCKHMVHKRMGNVYRKCGLMRAHWTGGGKTDILAKSPACSRWEGKGE